MKAGCGGEGPAALWRRVDRARGLFVRASRARRPAAQALGRRALLILDRADQMRYRGVTHGTIGEACSSALTGFVRRVQGGAARWQAEPSFPR